MEDRSIYPLGKRRTVIVFAGLLLGMLLAALDQTIVSTALPSIVRDLGGLEHYSWVFSAYMLASTVTVPLYGKLSDLYGRRPFFLLGILLFSTGSILSGLAGSMAMLIVGRGVQGLGAGALIPLALAVIGDIIPARRRPKWQGAMGAMFAFSSVLGPAVGGWLTDNATWRWCFFVNLPIAATALAVVWFGFEPKQRRERHSIDYLGATLLVLGSLAGLLAAVWGGSEYPWASVQIVGLLLVSAVLLGGFVLQERRAAEPILPPPLFRNPTVRVAIVALFMLGAAMFGTIIYVPLFVQRVLGESATSSGTVLTPLMLGLITTSLTAGQIVSRTGRYRPVLLTGPIVTGVGLFLLTRIGVDTTSLAVTRDIVLVGLGIGLLFSTFTVVVQNAVARTEIGVATAATQFFRSIGATVGVTVMGTIVTAGLGTGAQAASPAALANALRPAFFVALGLMAVAFLVTLRIPQVELRSRLGDPVPEVAD
jgi:EmrB/QacA subfamily drug resistance transporter